MSSSKIMREPEVTASTKKQAETSNFVIHDTPRTKSGKTKQLSPPTFNAEEDSTERRSRACDSS